jgi:orotate phosphoribosyltransferase
MNSSTVVEQYLEETGALKRGHFLLSSGLHSDRYCQCAALFEQPAMAGKVAALMAEKLRGIEVDTVLAPALGGILWGYELARALGARSLFAERKPGEPFALRRGFHLRRGERVLLAEDVVTTGKSVLEVVPLVTAAEAELVGFCAIADRSKGEFKPGKPFHTLISLNFETWSEGNLPSWLAEIPVEKPGSRQIGS